MRCIREPGAMNTAVIVAIIAAVPVSLGLLGGMTRYIITTILDAYKAQAAGTVAAKDAEIGILREMLKDERAEVGRLHVVNEDLRASLKVLAQR